MIRTKTTTEFDTRSNHDIITITWRFINIITPTFNITTVCQCTVLFTTSNKKGTHVKNSTKFNHKILLLNNSIKSPIMRSPSSSTYKYEVQSMHVLSQSATVLLTIVFGFIEKFVKLIFAIRKINGAQ